MLGQNIFSWSKSCYRLWADAFKETRPNTTDGTAVIFFNIIISPKLTTTEKDFKNSEQEEFALYA